MADSSTSLGDDDDAVVVAAGSNRLVRLATANAHRHLDDGDGWIASGIAIALISISIGFVFWIEWTIATNDDV